MSSDRLVFAWKYMYHFLNDTVRSNRGRTSCATRLISKTCRLVPIRPAGSLVHHQQMIPELSLHRPFNLPHLRIQCEHQVVEFLHHRPGSEAAQTSSSRFGRARRVPRHQGCKARLSPTHQFEYGVAFVEGRDEDVLGGDTVATKSGSTTIGN